MRALRFGSLFLFALAACAEGGAPSADAGGGRDGAVGCVPACVGGQVCVSGVCTDTGTDRDEDGVPVEVDCDDRNPDVGRTGSRSCGECSTELCTDGVWGECFEGDCECTAADPVRIENCGLCGSRSLECRDGRYEVVGECMGEGFCEPGSLEVDTCPGGMRRRSCIENCTWSEWDCDGDPPSECEEGQIDRETQPCGTCGGTQERSRTCVSGTWGAWSAFGACTETGGECAPGAMESESQACGNCGTQTRTRRCGDSCRWEPWGAFGACSGGGECAAGETRPCPNGDSCGVERCSDTCSWGSCEPNRPGGCLRIRPGTAGPPGNNFECCSPTSWRFCLSSCEWAPMCAPTSSC